MTTNFFLGLAFLAASVLGSKKTSYAINKCIDIRQVMNAVADRGFEGCRRIQDVDSQTMTDAEATLYVACNKKLAQMLIDNPDGSVKVSGALAYYRLKVSSGKRSTTFLDEVKQCYPDGDIVPKEQVNKFEKCGLAAYHKICPPIWDIPLATAA